MTKEIAIPESLCLCVKSEKELTVGDVIGKNFILKKISERLSPSLYWVEIIPKLREQ